jgi:hypothetical protein
MKVRKPPIFRARAANPAPARAAAAAAHRPPAAAGQGLDPPPLRRVPHRQATRQALRRLQGE